MFSKILAILSELNRILFTKSVHLELCHRRQRRHIDFTIEVFSDNFTFLVIVSLDKAVKILFGYFNFLFLSINGDNHIMNITISYIS